VTPGERAKRERLAQGLPERIQDQATLDRVAAILAEIPVDQAAEGGGRAPSA
jgi:hypothetical protein